MRKELIKVKQRMNFRTVNYFYLKHFCSKCIIFNKKHLNVYMNELVFITCISMNYMNEIVTLMIIVHICTCYKCDFIT